MPFLETAAVQLHYRGELRGGTPVLFLHGNLGCGDWIDLVARRLAGDLGLIAPDWRGCGDSEKPVPEQDFANYSMAVHADDMLGLLDGLGIDHCHLLTHSTGDLIATHMLLRAPERFGRVLSISPVGPMGLAFTEAQLQGFGIMRDNPEVARAGLATAVPTLFDIGSLAPGRAPAFADSATREQRELFEHLLARTRVLSDGIWVGTPYHLDRTWRDGGLRQRQEDFAHPRRILWGSEDAWIPRADVEEMADRMPRCELEVVEGIGHSLNVEAPDLCARAVEEFLRTT